MGAACTHLEVSPEAARSIREHPIQISDASFETIWYYLSRTLRSAVERHKIRQLLKTYLETNSCTDRYLVLYIKDIKWIFEITSHRRTYKYTGLVLSNNTL
jgi:hypothetical protein